MAEGLREQQFRLAAHIRDPQRQAPPPGIEDRRLAVYRELFFNNLDGLLSGNFPVLRRLLGEDGFRRLVRGFMVEHRARTPLFPELGREFLRYLESRADTHRDDPPWLQELAHYEWVELALEISDAAIDASGSDADGDLLAGAPLLSPLAWPLAYRWPVHRLAIDYQPASPPEAMTFLLVLRDAARQVRFHEISALSFRLLQRIEDAPSLSGREQLLALAGEADARPDGFIPQGLAMLESFRDSGVLLGTRIQ
jgi:hypothetical protein